MDFIDIHTHDRIRYKRCRRKWDLSSPVRRHLEPKQDTPNINLWFGTGFHFALEDYHGFNRFGDPAEALLAFYKAFRPNELPEGSEDIITLGMDMFDHYKRWLEYRDSYRTVWIEGVPQVEVRFALELTDLSEIAGKPVVFRGTIDRVVEDANGNWWVQDFKTAAHVDLNKLANDPQIGNYVWAAEQYYQREIMGMVYTQFAKKVPKQPTVLKSGELSLNKQQKTTHYLYRKELLDRYPDGNFPPRYVEFLNHLASLETPEGDEYIRQDEVQRNIHAKVSTYNHMWKEVREMIDPDLAIYPNPTRDCSWDCTEFRPVCIAMDEGDDYEYLIQEFYRRKEEDDETWRDRIQYPVPTT